MGPPTQRPASALGPSLGPRGLTPGLPGWRAWPRHLPLAAVTGDHRGLDGNTHRPRHPPARGPGWGWGCRRGHFLASSAFLAVAPHHPILWAVAHPFPAAGTRAAPPSPATQDGLPGSGSSAGPASRFRCAFSITLGLSLLALLCTRRGDSWGGDPEEPAAVWGTVARAHGWHRRAPALAQFSRPPLRLLPRSLSLQGPCGAG